MQFAFDLSKYSMPVCFFAHPNEIQLDLASLTSSNWKHINLMYKVEKRMQLKTSGTWNDILVTALTTQPGQWPRNASSTGAGAGLQNTLYYQGKNSPPAYTSASAGHTCPALLNKFLSLCLFQNSNLWAAHCTFGRLNLHNESFILRVFSWNSLALMVMIVET